MEVHLLGKKIAYNIYFNALGEITFFRERNLVTFKGWYCLFGSDKKDKIYFDIIDKNMFYKNIFYNHNEGNGISVFTLSKKNTYTRIRIYKTGQIFSFYKINKKDSTTMFCKNWYTFPLHNKTIEEKHIDLLTGECHSFDYPAIIQKNKNEEIVYEKYYIYGVEFTKVEWFLERTKRILRNYED